MIVNNLIFWCTTFPKPSTTLPASGSLDNSITMGSRGTHHSGSLSGWLNVCRGWSLMMGVLRRSLWNLVFLRGQFWGRWCSYPTQMTSTRTPAPLFIYLFADVCLIYRRIQCQQDATLLKKDLDQLCSWARRWQMWQWGAHQEHHDKGPSLPKSPVPESLWMF